MTKQTSERTATDEALSKGLQDFSDNSGRIFDMIVDDRSDRFIALRKMPPQEAYEGVFRMMAEAMQDACSGAVLEMEVKSNGK